MTSSGHTRQGDSWHTLHPMSDGPAEQNSMLNDKLTLSCKDSEPRINKVVWGNDCLEAYTQGQPPHNSSVTREYLRTRTTENPRP